MSACLVCRNASYNMRPVHQGFWRRPRLLTTVGATSRFSTINGNSWFFVTPGPLINMGTRRSESAWRPCVKPLPPWSVVSTTRKSSAPASSTASSNNPTYGCHTLNMSFLSITHNYMTTSRIKNVQTCQSAKDTARAYMSWHHLNVWPVRSTLPMYTKVYDLSVACTSCRM